MNIKHPARADLLILSNMGRGELVMHCYGGSLGVVVIQANSKVRAETIWFIAWLWPVTAVNFGVNCREKFLGRGIC